LQFKASWGKQFADPISEIPITKRVNGVAQGEGLEFKPQYHRKKKKKKDRVDFQAK
jgi:hypothetical protein